MQPRERNISLDLYRFLCMFLITSVHAFGYCNLTSAVSPDHFNFYLVNALSVLQRFSITGFVLISSYFLVETQETLHKIITFWLQLLFFSLATLLLARVFDPNAFSTKYLLKSLFPVFSYHYWYPVSYLILLVFAPILNKLIRSCPKKDLLRTILLLGFFLSVFFHFNPFMDEYVFVGHYSHSLIWFFFLYLIAGYIRLYGVRKPVLFGPILFLVCSAVMYIVFVVDRLAAKAGPSYAFIITLLDQINLQSYNSLLPLLISVSSFVMFLHFKPSVPKWLNKTITFLVPATFGIYLIQEHNAIRSAFWESTNLAAFAHSPWLLPMIVLVFLCLWGAAIVLYLLYRLARKLFLGKLENVLLDLSKKIFVRSSPPSNP